MIVNQRLILLASVISAMPLISHAGSLECQGTIISQGATERELLNACGEPTSRDGENWIYQVPGSIEQVVTLSNGFIMFIRDADAVNLSGSPMKDQP